MTEHWPDAPRQSRLAAALRHNVLALPKEAPADAVVYAAMADHVGCDLTELRNERFEDMCAFVEWVRLSSQSEPEADPPGVLMQVMGAPLPDLPEVLYPPRPKLRLVAIETDG